MSAVISNMAFSLASRDAPRSARANARRCASRLPIALGLCALVTMGCQQQMARQPSYRPLEPSTFFSDGQSARPLVPGTVARGQLATFANGNRTDARPAAALVGLGSTGPLNMPALIGTAVRAQILGSYVREFPFRVTPAVLRRGQERYTIFCSVCHGATGQGDGKIVERGYTSPPSFIEDNSRGLKYRGVNAPLRDVPAGYYFEVISKGFGAMPDYSAQVPPRDRWAIIAYIRALQLSQHARLADLPASVRQTALTELENPHERGSTSDR